MGPSSAKMSGWSVTILSDQWIIRGYSTHEAWKPGPMLVQAQSRPQQARSQQQQPAIPSDQQAILDALVCFPRSHKLLTVGRLLTFFVPQPELQRPLVMQICQQTGLNVKFALDCLTGNSWDMDRAVANFNEVKVSCASSYPRLGGCIWKLGHSHVLLYRGRYPGTRSCRTFTGSVVVWGNI